MDGLEAFIHREKGLDPLVRMTLIHHQFESIHPFYDDNGRTGRIINILFFVKEGLLDYPILYLSRYIGRTRADYYEGLQQVRDHGNWEPWLLYMLGGGSRYRGTYNEPGGRNRTTAAGLQALYP